MNYSNWRDSYWHTSSTTGAPQINQSSMFIHPKRGDHKTFTYEELMQALLDRDWVCSNFPDVPDMHLNEVLFFIHAFFNDMRQRYRYPGGFKEPQLGGHNEKRSTTDNRLILDWGQS